MGTRPKGTSVLVLERPGATIMSGIAKNNPFPRNTCGRATCPFGPQDCREKCYKENITYQAVCERCRIQPEEERERNPRLPNYIGETSRTLFTRYQQHVADYKKLSSVGPTNMLREPDRTSWMWEHSIQVHGGPENYLRDFSFLLFGQYQRFIFKASPRSCKNKPRSGERYSYQPSKQRNSNNFSEQKGRMLRTI